MIFVKQKLKDISLHLLDLGKRNRLLNYKPTGYRSIEVLNDNFEELFEKISSGMSLSIFQLDPVLQKYNKTIEGTEEGIEEYSKGKVKDIALPLVKANDVLCYKKGFSLNKILKVIHREYKNTLMEKGINTLYMTFGMVRYVQKKESYDAPLLLIPLQFDFSNFKIKEYEDEIILNPTLAYLFETEYKVKVDPFVENESTLQEYFSKTSNLLASNEMQLSFTITIGIYSFLKMNMFHDLNENTEIILQSANIKRILGNAEIDDVVSELQPIFPVVDADESQIKAIQDASNGESFVLQGPPGTGKSQTITNMIASLIASGKKVLFVSEKQAALNVVYENLKRAGLESFALELHSHKANKKDFIDELYQTATLPRYDIKSDLDNIKHEYAFLEEKLLEYRSCLHRKIPHLNLTMYEVYGNYKKLADSALTYPIQNIQEFTYQDLEDIKHLFMQYSMLSKSLGSDYHRGPFYGFTCKDVFYMKYHAKHDFVALYEFYKNLQEVSKGISYCIPVSMKSYRDIVEIMPKLDMILQLNHFLPELFIKDKRSQLTKLLNKYLSAYEKTSKSTLNKFLDLKIIKLPLEELTLRFEQKSKSVFKYFSKSFYALRKELRSYAKFKMKDADLIIKLKEAIEYQKQWNILNKTKTMLPENFHYKDYKLIYEDALKFDALSFDLALTRESYIELKKRIIDIVVYFKKINTISLTEFTDKFNTQIIELIDQDIKDLYLKFSDMLDSLELLELHAQQLEIIAQFEKRGILSFVDQAIEENLNVTKWSACYERNFWQATILFEVEQQPILREFSGLGVDAILSRFKELDRYHLETNKAFIISKLSNLRPDESILIGSKFSILVKEFNKSRKQKPIRVLLEELSDLILDIKPIFLMSPLSVSTYLSNHADLFDTVIFDEASQVFSWDALGAIYRAKQCIIIGDSKQMPPSMFFTSAVEDEEDYENDIESILDKGSSVFATKRLNWHYRSRSEELIAFSNHNFYDGRLITIPQAKPHTPGFGVDFHFVNGTYEVKERTNEVEAKAIIKLIENHIKTKPNQSLGVVAFSKAQADLILDMLEPLEEQEDLKFFFEEDKPEPFFVKNLESVQGDERDVILFSICYGYTAEHKFYQRFGPLNNLGGERRLNVAITRAKENICLVSSIHARDIKLENTESVGVTLLKKYLEYAESITTPKHLTEITEDGVLNSVAEFLKKEGYMVETRVGTSSFKIDISVKHNHRSIAIMLDGPSYLIGNCSDANALQERLLNRLGWQFYRIFSTLWVHQERLEKEKLQKFLKDCFYGTMPNAVDVEKKQSLLLEKEDTFDDRFAAYPYVSDEEIHKLYNQISSTELIHHIICKEEPIHIEYLLKRICFIYGRTKVTNLVREYFEADIKELSLFKDNCFLSTHPITSMELRLPSTRMIDQIHPLELKDAIYKVVKMSNGITKEGCFKRVTSLLGYNRMSENTMEHLEHALVFLKLDGQVIERQDCLYV